MPEDHPRFVLSLHRLKRENEFSNLDVELHNYYQRDDDL